MREKRAGVVIFEEVDLTQEQFDQPILWLLAAMLAFMPAAFGSWDPWAETFALAGACGLAAMLGIKLVRRTDVPFVWSWTYLPIALFFLVALLQLLPLPAAWVGAISPKTAATYRSLLGDEPDAAARLAHLRFSFYQEGTWHDLRNLVAVSSVFVVVVNVFRRPQQIVQLLWVIAWVGAAEGLLAILQIITHAPGVYWVAIQWGNARPESGTFPNHNCFAQFMNLSTGAMLGLLLLRVDKTFRRHDYESAEIAEKLSSSDFRSAYLLAGMIAISVSSVFLSLSRGGMLSIAIAGVLVGVLLAIRGGARGMGIGGWVAGAILVIVFALVMAGGANLVEGRIARMGNPDDRYDRFRLTKDTIRAWQDYPELGMGLGSFRYTFPHYDRTPIGTLASHAEDEYAQILEETGAAGASIAGCFLIMIINCFLRARARGRKSRENGQEQGAEELAESAHPISEQTADRSNDSATGPAVQSRSPSGRHGRGKRRHGGSHHHRSRHAASPASSISLGLCCGLVAILVQSATDFGQHCISIACLTAISCALLVNLASLRRRERELEPDLPVVRGLTIVRLGAVGIIVVLSALILRQSNEFRAARAAFDREIHLADQLSNNQWHGDPGDVVDMNRAADESTAARPNDVWYRYRRAVNRFNAVTADAPVDPVAHLYVLDKGRLATVRDMANDLQQARWICPTYGTLYVQLGQWERYFLGHPAEGARHIRMGLALAPNDPTAAIETSIVDGEEGAWTDSLAHFQLAVQLSSSQLSDVLDMIVTYFHRPDLALQFADGNIERLRMVAGKLRALGKDPAQAPTPGPATQPADEDFAKRAERQADALTRAAADRPDASAETLGEMGMLCARTEDSAGAVKYLGRALLYDYAQVDWRMAYARNLALLGRNDDAIQQAETVLRIRPQMPEAVEFVEKLSVPSTRAVQELSQ